MTETVPANEIAQFAKAIVSKSYWNYRDEKTIYQAAITAILAGSKCGADGMLPQDGEKMGNEAADVAEQILRRYRTFFGHNLAAQEQIQKVGDSLTIGDELFEEFYRSLFLKEKTR